MQLELEHGPKPAKHDAQGSISVVITATTDKKARENVQRDAGENVERLKDPDADQARSSMSKTPEVERTNTDQVRGNASTTLQENSERLKATSKRTPPASASNTTLTTPAHHIQQQLVNLASTVSQNADALASLWVVISKIQRIADATVNVLDELAKVSIGIARL